VYPDGSDPAIAAAIEDALQRRYNVGGVDEDKDHAHFVATVPILRNHEKRDHMMAHYGAAPTVQPQPPDAQPSTHDGGAP
jgi:hypothetical protein